MKVMWKHTSWNNRCAICLSLVIVLQIKHVSCINKCGYKLLSCTWVSLWKDKDNKINRLCCVIIDTLCSFSNKPKLCVFVSKGNWKIWFQTYWSIIRCEYGTAYQTHGYQTIFCRSCNSHFEFNNFMCIIMVLLSHV